MSRTPTPPLRRRVVLGGVAVLAVVLLAVNSAVYVAFAASLRSSLDEVLAERVESVRLVARAVAVDGSGAEGLARQLQARGLRAVVTGPDGQQYRSEPDSPVLSGLPAARVETTELVSRTVAVRGATVEVFARSGVGSALRRLLALQVGSSLLAMGLAGLLLSRASTVALRPVDDIVAAARRTAGGERGDRLRPDRPDTELGRMAVAYDEMLDALEAGYEVAAKLERRRGSLEARWRQALEVAEEAYVSVDAGGVVLDCNSQALTLIGLPRDELVGRSAAAIVAERHRDDFLRQVRDIAERGPRTGAEAYVVDVVAADGRTFPAECLVWSVDRRRGAVLHVFLRDVAERRRAEEAVARLAAVVEGSSDAIVTKSLDGHILSWNPAAERMYGWSAAEASGQHISLIVPDDRLDEEGKMLELVRGGKRLAALETERVSRSGERLPVSVRVSPVHDRHGRVVAASVISRDVTEQRWMAETLDQTLAALQAALDEARASEETTRRFLADAAHQLRTPIAGIRACAETLLRGGSSGEDADRLMATMVRETSRAARLIAALLQMARLDQGLAVASGPVDVVALCRDEVERLSLLCPDIEVVLDVRRAPRGPLLVDGAACREVLSNLGDNARRHARNRVEVRVEALAGEVLVTVRDDGQGVPEDQRDLVFERFVSLDGRGGSGLGLPIARGLARAMGGDLAYVDGFVLTLPDTADADADADADASAG